MNDPGQSPPPSDDDIAAMAGRATAAQTTYDHNLVLYLDRAGTIANLYRDAPPAARWATLAAHLSEDLTTRPGGLDFAVGVLTSALLRLVEGGDR